MLSDLQTLIFSLVITVMSQHVATAADINQLFGKWIEKFANGNGMVTEFTTTTISSYAVDRSGNQTSQPNTMAVSYKDLGDTIAIQFKGGTGIMALIRDPKTISLIFPGMGSHLLVRLEP